MAKVALSYGHGSNTYEANHSKFVIHNGVVYEEHTFNAAVGVKVRDLLEAHSVQVLELQPPMGPDIPLRDRTNAANAWGADIYWSIHANAGASTARGLCGFYYQGSTGGKKLADLYAKYCKAEGFPSYSDYTFESVPGTWADFHELRESHMPACLTENGFMTNAEDFKLIFENKDNYYERLATVHVKAILEYFGIAFKSPVKNGWVIEGGVWCFYTNGVKLKNNWAQDKEGKWFYLDEFGHMAVSRWVEWKEKWCFVGTDGAMVTGRHTINGKDYYFQDNGYLVITDSNGAIING